MSDKLTEQKTELERLRNLIRIELAVIKASAERIDELNDAIVELDIASGYKI
jgi:uncharacterized coiled-coil protein SlyX